MKIKSLKIKNFRGYCDEISINFDEFTAFVGKNDIGKSSIMDALDIFFNDGKGVVKLDKEDVNVGARANQENEINDLFIDLKPQNNKYNTNPLLYIISIIQTKNQIILKVLDSNIIMIQLHLYCSFIVVKKKARS